MFKFSRKLELTIVLDKFKQSILKDHIYYKNYFHNFTQIKQLFKKIGGPVLQLKVQRGRERKQQLTQGRVKGNNL